MYKEVFRLATLLAFVALATSRLGLVGHELIGHGGMARLCGLRIDDVQLFWFAGGWIRYHLAGESSLASAIAVSLAGIALELVVGTALCMLVRRPTLGGRLVRGIGIALVVHASWYLAAGTFHGFGDGIVLYRVLGAWRVLIAVAAGLITCAATFFGARMLLGVLIATLPGSRRARMIGVLLAVLFAGGLHAGLAAGELALRRDDTYGQLMQHERERKIAIAMQRWQQEHADVSATDMRAERARLERANRTFPFVWLLAAATLAAAIAGAWRARSYPDQRISNRLVAIFGAVAAGAICIVVAIDALVAM